ARAAKTGGGRRAPRGRPARAQVRGKPAVLGDLARTRVHLPRVPDRRGDDAAVQELDGGLPDARRLAREDLLPAIVRDLDDLAGNGDPVLGVLHQRGVSVADAVEAILRRRPRLLDEGQAERRLVAADVAQGAADREDPHRSRGATRPSSSTSSFVPPCRAWLNVVSRPSSSCTRRPASSSARTSTPVSTPISENMCARSSVATLP